MTGDDALLQAFLDGELEPEAAARLAARLDREPALLRRLEALELTAEATSRAVEARLALAPDLAPRVAAAAAGEGRRPAVPARWVRAVPWAAAAVAAAASVALVVGPGGPGPAGSFIHGGPTLSPSGTARVLPTPPEDQEPLVAIEAVDFGAHPGAILVSEEEGAIPVVWVTDEGVGATL